MLYHQCAWRILMYYLKQTLLKSLTNTKLEGKEGTLEKIYSKVNWIQMNYTVCTLTKEMTIHQKAFDLKSFIELLNSNLLKNTILF